METTPPFPVVSGQRQLAVIMFTDAVSYSARMHEQEVATLNRMERDTLIMRSLAEARGGNVVKSTGDGLLILFGSAVQAVSCALEIQQRFAGRGQPGHEAGSLRHRIGIHLGDVFVGGDDVMGDGVNIAARLVALAPPGGIIVSQMVHDVVKNKLSLHAVPLGPRGLKNIKEPMPLFRLLLDAPGRPAGTGSGGATAPAPPVAAPAPRQSARVWLVGLALAGIGGAGWYLVEAQRAHERELRRSQAEQAALAELLRRPVDEPDRGPAATPGFDFAAAVTSVPARARDVPEPAERLREAERLEEALLAWLPTALAAHTRDRPLRVRGLGDPAFPGATVYTDERGRLVFAEGGASRPREWAELSDPVRAALVVAVARAAPASAPVDLSRAAAAHAYLRGRPEVVAALRP